MSCFFGCFRIKNGVSKPIRSKPSGSVCPNRQLASVLLRTEDGSSFGERNFGNNSIGCEQKNEHGDSDNAGSSTSRRRGTPLKKLFQDEQQLDQLALYSESNQSEDKHTCFGDESDSARPTSDNPVHFEGADGALLRENNARTRLEYVHPVLNPVENSSKRRSLKEGSHQFGQSEDKFEQLTNLGDSDNAQNTNCDLHPDERKCHFVEPNVNGEYVSPGSPSSVIPALNNKEPQVIVSSLSQWLKPPAAREGSQKSLRSTDEDRPIIGMVAAHWSEDEPSPTPPKPWDGKGIPNSTNKYKEDQKVSWHAMSFEERLEKALSEESLLSQRKPPDGKGVKGEGSWTIQLHVDRVVPQAHVHHRETNIFCA